MCEDKKESLFYLMVPLEHIDFPIIGYWKSSIWSLWDISLEETCCHHIGYAFREAARDLLYAPSHRQDSTYHSLWWTNYEPLVVMKNSPNCKCIHHAVLIRWSQPAQAGALLPELCPPSLDVCGDIGSCILPVCIYMYVYCKFVCMYFF